MFSRLANVSSSKASILYSGVRLIASGRAITATQTPPQVCDKVKVDLEHLHRDIRATFTTNRPELNQIAAYYFDGSGKSIRPLIVCSMARALNTHYGSSVLLDTQRQIALISEMIHVASLIHDDIVDGSALRRGKTSVNTQWGCHKAVLAGDYVMAVASGHLARMGNVSVVECLTEVLLDLVQGELMQFGNKEKESERFEHYSMKTYRKTASLIANSCRAVCILNGSADAKMTQLAFECGKNIGIAFQIIDDILDFTAAAELGKPGLGADLRLGLATAPVLFAAVQYPQLNAMIMRRFSQQGDAAEAFELVQGGDGIREARFLATKYAQTAIRLLDSIKATAETEYLKEVIRSVLTRAK